MAEVFTERVQRIIGGIPPGKVMTYGLVASRAGNRAGARQVARILHATSEKHDLPWHRVVNREGRISLPPGRGHEEQRALLAAEGVRIDGDGRIDLDRFLWHGRGVSEEEQEHLR